MENLQDLKKMLTDPVMPFDSTIFFSFLHKEMVPVDTEKAISSSLKELFLKLAKGTVLKNKLELKYDLDTEEGVEKAISENSTKCMMELDINNNILETEMEFEIYYCNRQAILDLGIDKVTKAKFKAFFGEIEYK